MWLQSLVDGNPPDLIHLHDFRSFQAVCAFILASRCRVPLVLQPHGTLQVALGKVREKKTYDIVVGRRILRRAARIVALSPQEAESCRGLGVPASKVEVIPNGVALPSNPVASRKRSFRSTYGIGHDELVVLFVGRIRESKGVGLLVEAFEDFLKTFPKSVLAVCGPDDGGAGIVEAAATRGLRIVMTGTLIGEDKFAALAESDIFCLPSAFETQSVALLEAASRSLPIVASAQSVPEEFVQNQAGLFISLGRNSLAAALVRLAGSESLRRELGVRARATAERYFSSESMLERFRDLYEAVLSETCRIV